MHNVLRLTKAYYQGVKPFSQTIAVKNKVGKVFMTILLLYGFFAIAFMLGLSCYNAEAAREGYAMLYSVIVTSFILFSFSLVNISSQYVSAQDLPLSLVLPIPTKDIVRARTLIVASGYLLFTLTCFVPGVVVTILIRGFSLSFLLSSIVLFFDVFALTFFLTLILSFTVQHLSKGRSRHQAGGKTFAIIAFILVIVGCVRVMLSDEGDPTAVTSTMDAIVRFFPFFGVLAKSCFHLPTLLLVTFITIAFSYGAERLAEHWFLSLAQTKGSGEKRRKKQTKEVKTHGLLASLEGREKMIIMSNTVFKMEYIMSIIMPVFLIVFYIAIGISGYLLENFSSSLSDSNGSKVIFLVFAIFSAVGAISSTSVSRQGKLFFLDRTFPLDAKVFVKAKLLFHLKSLFLPYTLYLLISVFYTKQATRDLLWMVPMLFGTITTSSLIGLAIDYSRPHLEWTLPQQAMKSNTNTLFAMMANILLVTMVGVLLFLSPLPVAIVALLLIGWLCWLWANKAARKALSGQ